MMYHEFLERTKIEVSAEEYHYIELSYYDFDGNKDEFCKAWKRDKKSGRWDLEYRLRKALDDQKAEYEAKLREKEESLEFYRPYFDRAREAEKKLAQKEEAINNVVARMKRCAGLWSDILTA